MTDPNTEPPNTEPPFANHRRYYLLLKVAIVFFALWLVLHFTGVL